MDRKEAILQQIKFAQDVRKFGYNLVTCGNCGTVLLHKMGADEIDCLCGSIPTSYCSDLWFKGEETILEAVSDSEKGIQAKEWFSVSEVEPEQYRILLGTNNSDELYFVCYFDGENFRDSLHEKIIETEVTHWQYITPLQTK